MKLYARIIAMLCALVMLVAAFASCATPSGGENTTAPEAQTTAPTGDVTEAPVENLDAQGYLKDDLPENLNFGDTVQILYWSDAERAEFEIKEDEADGDLVKEEIYKRNITTESRLGITLEWIGQKGNVSNRSGFTSFVQNAYSGGVFYDAIATYSRTAAMLMTNGYLQDINAIEDNYIDIDKPWWPATMSSTCSIGDSLYFVSGDISTNVLHFMYAVYYNIDMIKEFQFEDPVTYVDDKTWTLDKLIEMASSMYQDMDAVAGISEGDRYGFCSEDYHLDALYTGAGLRLVEPAEDTHLKISDDFWGEKTVNLVDKIGKFLESGDALITGGKISTSIGYTVPFEEGNALFCLNRVYMADYEYHDGALRNADFEYGILPVPLYELGQENYVTVVGNPFTLWCVMDNAKNPAMSTAVLECMASEGYRKTSPALFETNMKYRYTPDEADKGDSARMFDIVRNTITFDLGRIYSDALDFMSEMPSNAAAAASSWSALMAQYKRSLTKRMTNLNTAIDDVIGK